MRYSRLRRRYTTRLRLLYCPVYAPVPFISPHLFLLVLSRGADGERGVVAARGRGVKAAIYGDATHAAAAECPSELRRISHFVAELVDARGGELPGRARRNGCLASMSNSSRTLSTFLPFSHHANMPSSRRL
jgi:hypothetical protein